MTTSDGTVGAFVRRNSMLLILIALYILVAVTARGFFTLDNQLNILRTIAVPGMIAFGMTLLIIVGEIDLSVGSMVAASACILAWLVNAISGGDFEPSVFVVIVAMILTFAFGAAVGIFNGWLRNRYMVPTFISSLAMMATLAGLANMITDGTPIESFPSWYYFIGSGRIFNIPMPVYLLLLSFAISYILANFTSFGRAVYAIGGNAEAARLSGLAVNRTRMTCLVITSLFAVMGGIVYSSLLNSGNPTIAKGMELEVISAVIIGGVSLFGGKGSIWGAFVGVLFLGVLLNAMTLWGFNPYAQQVVRGILILGAVFINLVIERPHLGHA